MKSKAWMNFSPHVRIRPTGPQTKSHLTAKTTGQSSKLPSSLSSMFMTGSRPGLSPPYSYPTCTTLALRSSLFMMTLLLSRTMPPSTTAPLFPSHPLDLPAMTTSGWSLPSRPSPPPPSSPTSLNHSHMNNWRPGRAA